MLLNTQAIERKIYNFVYLNYEFKIKYRISYFILWFKTTYQHNYLTTHNDDQTHLHNNHIFYNVNNVMDDKNCMSINK